MSNQINGILLMVLGVILAVLYFALPAFLMYTYWVAIILIIIYGVYTFRKDNNFSITTIFIFFQYFEIL